MSNQDSATAREPRPDLLEQVVAWIEDHSLADERMRQGLELIARSGSAELQLLGHVVAGRRARLLQRLLDTQDAVVDALSPDRVRRIKDPSVLVRVGQLVRDLVADQDRYIEARTREGAETSFALRELLNELRVARCDDPQRQVFEHMGPQKREAVRRLIDALIRKAEEVNETATPKTIAASDSASDAVARSNGSARASTTH